MGDINDQKKPFYTRWWFWVIITLLVLLLVSSINSGNKNTNDNQNAKITEGANDTTNNNTEDITGNDVNNENNNNTNNNTNNTENEDNTNVEVTTPPEDNSMIRDNSSAKLTELNTGTFMVGTDIPAGRYVIHGDGSGNLFIYDEAGMPYINEILGGGDLGVDTVTTDIQDGDKIEISGINKVTFTPAETKLYKDTLTTGNWIAGIDFPAGRYDVSSEDGNGNFFVYNKSDFPVVNEILGGGDIGVEKVTVNLEEGYKITISGMKSVKFTAK